MFAKFWYFFVVVVIVAEGISSKSTKESKIVTLWQNAEQECLAMHNLTRSVYIYAESEEGFACYLYCICVKLKLIPKMQEDVQNCTIREREAVRHAIKQTVSDLKQRKRDNKFKAMILDAIEACSRKYNTYKIEHIIDSPSLCEFYCIASDLAIFDENVLNHALSDKRMEYLGVLGASSVENFLKNIDESVKKLDKLCLTYDKVFDDVNEKVEEFEYTVRNFVPAKH